MSSFNFQEKGMKGEPGDTQFGPVSYAYACMWVGGCYVYDTGKECIIRLGTARDNRSGFFRNCCSLPM